METAELLRHEEEKRRRSVRDAERWRLIQQTIRWAEQQVTVRRNTPAACLREQQRKLAQLRTCAAFCAPQR
jgi:hypothetical protein